MFSETQVDAVVNAIVEVGRQRKAVLDKMRAALEAGDERAALLCARELCGLPVDFDKKCAHEEVH